MVVFEMMRRSCMMILYIWSSTISLCTFDAMMNKQDEQKTHTHLLLLLLPFPSFIDPTT